MLFQLGMTHYFLREYDDARNYFARALEIAPDSAVPFLQYNRASFARDGDVSGLTAVAESGLFNDGGPYAACHAA